MSREITHVRDEQTGHMRQVVSAEVLRRILREDGDTLTRPGDFGPDDEWNVGAAAEDADEDLQPIDTSRADAAFQECLETQARIGIDWPEVLGGGDCDYGRAEIRRIAAIDDAREREAEIRVAIDVAMWGAPFGALPVGSSEWERARAALRDSLLAEMEA